MPLKIDDIEIAYTPRGIVEKEYPKFWDLADKCRPILRGWQEIVVDYCQTIKKVCQAVKAQ